jgi:hypothetical protein
MDLTQVAPAAKKAKTQSGLSQEGVKLLFSQLRDRSGYKPVSLSKPAREEACKLVLQEVKSLLEPYEFYDKETDKIRDQLLFEVYTKNALDIFPEIYAVIPSFASSNLVPHGLEFVYKAAKNLVNEKIQQSYPENVQRKFGANSGRPKDILVDSLGKFIMFRLIDYLCRYERTCDVQGKQSIRSMTKRVKNTTVEESVPLEPNEEGKTAAKKPKKVEK